MRAFELLVSIARRKAAFDQTNPWAQGSGTYLREIQKEIQEVIEEISQGCSSSVEDELADVLWDYLNLVLALEVEQGITLESVFERAAQKYDERISGIEQGIAWQAIKEKQKIKLAKECEQKN